MVPEDVVSLILLWLPVATLVRFKSVCKSWYSLIQNPSFVIQHYNHLHLSNNHENLLVVNNPLYWDVIQHRNISLRSGDNNDFHEFETFGLPHDPSSCVFLLLNTSYNGVICLQHGESCKDFSLYNPTLKDFKILPEPPALLPQSSYCVHGGFGRDCLNNDYRVVRVAEELMPLLSHSDYTVKTTLVDVYSLTTDCWTTIDAAVPGYLRASNYGTPVRDGRYYFWLAAKGCSSATYHTAHHIIVSFDFSKDLFEAIPLPDVYDIDADLDLVLVSFNDNISCVETVRDTGASRFVFNVWLLNEYGVKDSWTKLYTTCIENSALPPVAMTIYYVTPTTFLKNGDIIWLENLCDEEEKTTLYLWDHVTKELNILPDQLGCGMYQNEVVAYKESLLSVSKHGMQLTL